MVTTFTPDFNPQIVDGGERVIFSFYFRLELT